RVGENSPSFCPTMFSVTYTGMNFLPLWTASVCPTISGTTVERRDQVLMTFLSPLLFMPSTFSSSGVSTNGPFFSDRLIYLSRGRYWPHTFLFACVPRLRSGRPEPAEGRGPSPRAARGSCCRYLTPFGLRWT